MSEVIYTHQLEWKEFNVSLSKVKTAIDVIAENCGFSSDSNLRIHFLVQPTEEQIAAINSYWDSLTDNGDYAAEQAKNVALELEEKKIGYGIKIRAFIGYQCELNSFTPVQYALMLADSDLAFCSQLLISGGLESVKGIIDSFTPTAYFTESMKSALSSELQKYIDLL